MPVLSEIKLKLIGTLYMDVHLYLLAFCLLVLIAYMYLTLSCKFYLLLKYF